MSATFQVQKEQGFVDAGTSDQTLRLALRGSKTKISTLCIPIDQVVIALALQLQPERSVIFVVYMCLLWFET